MTPSHTRRNALEKSSPNLKTMPIFLCTKVEVQRPVAVGNVTGNYKKQWFSNVRMKATAVGGIQAARWPLISPLLSRRGVLGYGPSKCCCEDSLLTRYGHTQQGQTSEFHWRSWPPGHLPPQGCHGMGCGTSRSSLVFSYFPPPKLSGGWGASVEWFAEVTRERGWNASPEDSSRTSLSKERGPEDVQIQKRSSRSHLACLNLPRLTSMACWR